MGKTLTAKEALNKQYGKFKEERKNMFYVQMDNGIGYMIEADEMNTSDDQHITFHKDEKMVGIVMKRNVEMVFKDIQPKLIGGDEV